MRRGSAVTDSHGQEFQPRKGEPCFADGLAFEEPYHMPKEGPVSRTFTERVNRLLPGLGSSF
jgi:hypothetical protein